MSNDKAIWAALNTGSVEAVAAALDPVLRRGTEQPWYDTPAAQNIATPVDPSNCCAPPVVDEAKERAEFEAWAIESGWAQQKNHLARNLEIDEYFNHIVEACWQGVLWRASRG